MRSLIRNFPNWWRPSKRTIDREEERRVTFLELFYDLVYVVIIAELAHALSGHVNPGGIGGFAFLQMFTVAAMAVFAHDAMGESARGFALSYASFQMILTYLWWRTGVHDPNHRPLTRPYSPIFLFLTLLVVASAFIHGPRRFYLYGAAVFISLLLPLITLIFGRRNPQVQAELERSISVSPSAVERFGLFTITVLG
jgi:low temperature requirement protein LtrA